MYDIKQINKQKIMVFLHEDCELDIHHVCKEIIRGKGEYIVRDENSAEIAFF